MCSLMVFYTMYYNYISQHINLFNSCFIVYLCKYCCKNPNFRIWPDMVHDLDQEKKCLDCGKNAAYEIWHRRENPDNTWWSLIRLLQDPSGCQVKWIYATTAIYIYFLFKSIISQNMWARRGQESYKLPWAPSEHQRGGMCSQALATLGVLGATGVADPITDGCQHP